jgi:hypothetical protein
VQTPTRVLAAATSAAPLRLIAQRLGEWLPRGRVVYIAKLPGGSPFSGEGEPGINIIEDWLREQSMQA